MTKEQEAIKNIKICIHDYISESVDEYGYTIYKISEEEQEFFENIETLLSMLKEKDKEIETLKRDFKIVDQECSRLERKEAKQDKIIDLMAEHIVNSAIVDDTVCAIKCDCETDIREECTYEKMLNCTKQYFERKATKLSARKEK